MEATTAWGCEALLDDSLSVPANNRARSRPGAASPVWGARLAFAACFAASAEGRSLLDSNDQLSPASPQVFIVTISPSLYTLFPVQPRHHQFNIGSLSRSLPSHSPHIVTSDPIPFRPRERLTKLS